MCVSGKEIMLEVLENKPAMEESLHPRNPDEAASLDSGGVPGDHCGAAGLDSALFAHLKRNWNWYNHVSDSDIDGTPSPVVNAHLPQVKKGLKGPVSVAAPKNLKQIMVMGETLSPKNFPSKRPTNPEVATTLVDRKKRRSNRPDKVRKMPMPRPSRRKPYYDTADLEALTLMSKLRVDWTAPEDNVLLLCKVASAYLSPNSRHQSIPMQAWRDLLHRSVDNARNKTSKAVQRRISYMMKNPSTARSVSLCLEEIKQDPKINRQFGNLMKTLKKRNESPEMIDKVMSEKFFELVDILQGRFQNMRSHPVAFEKMLIPNTIEELRFVLLITSAVLTYLIIQTLLLS